MMVQNTTSSARGPQRPPFLLEIMSTPHLPRGIAERLPFNVTFVVNVERGDPLHSVVSQQSKNNTHRTRTCESECNYRRLSSAGSYLRLGLCLEGC